MSIPNDDLVVLNLELFKVTIWSRKYRKALFLRKSQTNVYSSHLLISCGPKKIAMKSVTT